MAGSDPLDAVIAALADPTRRRMLSRLTEGEMTVAELAEPFELSPPGISKHLKVLERAGLIERGRNAQWRPCRLRAGPLAELADWLEPFGPHWWQPRNKPEVRIAKLRVGPVTSPEPEPSQPRSPSRPRSRPVVRSTGIDESHW